MKTSEEKANALRDRLQAIAQERRQIEIDNQTYRDNITVSQDKIVVAYNNYVAEKATHQRVIAENKTKVEDNLAMYLDLGKEAKGIEKALAKINLQSDAS